MEFEDALLLEAALYAVRVVAHIDGKWIFYPNPDNISGGSCGYLKNVQWMA